MEPISNIDLLINHLKAFVRLQTNDLFLDEKNNTLVLFYIGYGKIMCLVSSLVETSRLSSKIRR